jgi:mycobactin lysine-N-oxygenase
LTLSSNRGGEALETVHGFDLVIDGSGADSMWFEALFSQDARDVIELALRAPISCDALQESMGHDLSVTGVTPKLFLPGLSGLMQGPGFPNLSCLGLLSDRVLGAQYPSAEAEHHYSTRRSDEHEPV